MTSAAVQVPAELPVFADAFGRIRVEFSVPSAFPVDVEADAAASARRGPRAPGARRDVTDVPFVTIDPAGSLDLDQAFHAERAGPGFRVRYAIADVAAFVDPAGPVDRESFARGTTLYLPDGRAPMLPNVLGEDAASLLPGQARPALLWTIELDHDGAATTTRLERATVRSRAALNYVEVQRSLDKGGAEEPLELLREVGTLRQRLERARGGVSLNAPTQTVEPTGGGSFSLGYETSLPVEDWNAQISLLTGMEAAKIMVEAGSGVLRTLPPPAERDVARLRRSAAALAVNWPAGAAWADVVRSVDASEPGQAAFLVQAAHLLRGAGYTKLDASNTHDASTVPVHAGVAAPYAHVTAPLRRLVDRYANEVVVAYCAGSAPPEWAQSALDEVATAMTAASRHSSGVERAVVDAVECVVLSGHVGEDFDAVVVDTHEGGVVVQLAQPAVVAPLPAKVELGRRLKVRVVAVDPVARRVQLIPA